MGGLPPRPSCDPNPCHPGVTCTVTPQGITCGACPDGMEGNGTYCKDVDEVISSYSRKFYDVIEHYIIL